MTWLDRPLDGSKLPLGPVTILAHASDADGVASFEFFVDNDPLATAPAAGDRLGEGTVGWTPTEPGTYTIRARAIDTQGNPGSEATSVVTVGELPAPSPTPSPRPEESELLFFVEPEVVPAGGCAVLWWEIDPPAEALLDGVGVPPTGEREVCPEGTTTYELLVPERDQMRTVTLHVEPPPEAELAIFFAVEPDAIPQGECAILLWEVGAPEEWPVLVDGQEVPHAGEQEVCPQNTTTYELLVETPGGPEARTVTLHVEAAPEPTTTPTSLPTPTTPPGCPGPPAISSLTANPSTITAGGSTTLNWGPVTNGNSDVLVRSVVIEPGLGEVGSPGSRVVSPGSTTTYRMTATGCGGTATQQVTIIVNPGPPPAFAADVAITDLYPETLYGPVWVRVTNHGPGTLTNVTVQLSCQWTQTIEGRPLGSGQMGPMPLPISSLSPGQTTEFNTDISLDLHQYQYDMTCTIQVPFNDPTPGNNSYSEKFT
ncbi:MAG: Ig-like domain-containing protein [Anaerolineae bacterium]